MTAAEEGVGRMHSRPVHDGRIVHLTVDTVRFPDGSTGELEMIRHSGASAVLAIVGRLDDDDPEVVLVRQYRYAAGGYLFEVPAGRPAFQGEDWEVCARRELEEETGLVPGRMRRLTSILTTPGFTDERIHLFVAEELRPGRRSLDEDEFIELRRIPLSRAVAMIGCGEITDAKSVCTILFAVQFRAAR